MANYLRELLNHYYRVFNEKDFIVNDPISIPHLFTKKEDIEIAGFFASAIAWGNRKAILKSCHELMDRMDNSPYDFIMNYCKKDIDSLKGFYYRTFQETDTYCFADAIQNIYKNHGGLEKIFTDGYNESQYDKIKNAIIHFRKIFFEHEYPQRVSKHIADPAKGSASKRINMFLRWMVRNDSNGVDFGIWKGISPSDLVIPLDVHVGNVGRKLGLITAKANNWQAAMELTDYLKTLDKKDPVKYDFALFGIGNAGIEIDSPELNQ
ncbi:MAG: TIGR02757 family protein [Bacteroidales bacterium]|nr:TIGR02757 family protein [Bacteroidales bacterium]